MKVRVLFFLYSLLLLLVVDLIDDNYFKAKRNVQTVTVGPYVTVDRKGITEYLCDSSNDNMHKVCLYYYIEYKNRTIRTYIELDDYIKLNNGDIYQIRQGYKKVYPDGFENAKLMLYFQMMLYLLIAIIAIVWLFKDCKVKR